MRQNILKWAAIICWFIVLCLPVNAATIKIATYNVDNLFDAVADGTEYPEYVPGGPYGWDRDMADIKAANIARVLTAMKADIVCLQEVESRRALDLLVNKLKNNGTPYPYAAIADKVRTTVKCALISIWPITASAEISPGENMRSILRATVTVGKNPLTLFVNHWKSKQGPESRRVVYAKALKAAIDRLAPDADYLIIGDFNANYDEFVTFRDVPRLNDTNGLTGINQVLGTAISGRMVSENMLVSGKHGHALYNLWLELPPSRRWSYKFYGAKDSLDNIILPRGLFDSRGISYVDDSFDRFDPAFLFDEKGNIFRWQQADYCRGRHLGRGYSDHLPLFALFSTDPFQSRPASGQEAPAADSDFPVVSVSALYRISPGRVNLSVKNCVVIYKHRDNAVIKQPRGRAIYVYRSADKLKFGQAYDLGVKRLCDYQGLREICELDIDRQTGKPDTVSDLMIQKPGMDLTDRAYQNEVVAEISGVFRKGRLYYNSGRSIRIYFKNQKWEPPQGAAVKLKNARIGFHVTPEIVVEEQKQIELPEGT